jgi:isoleucyl-tRNA synthetase
MSKSLGNVVAPEKIIEQYGADVLRLWVASVDFTNDVKIGPNFLTQLAEVYKKVRNTIRFILGNLNGFNPSSDLQPLENLSLLDKTILHRLTTMVENLDSSFEKYEFHAYYQALQNFCVTDLSSLYFDVAKDILYTAHPKSTERLAIQTVLYQLLESLLSLLVPVMPHLAEDIWQSLPEEQKFKFGFSDSPKSILLAPWPKAEFKLSTEELAAIDLALKLRQEANLAIEPLRKEGKVGSNLEIELTAKLKSQTDKQLLENYFSKRQLEQLVIISNLSLSDELSGNENLSVEINISNHTKCNRCWKRLPSVGTHSDHPEICTECRDVVLQVS